MKNWKKMLLGLTCVISLGALAACSKESGEASKGNKAESDKLVIYSPNSEGLINATIPAFEEKYGIKVELIQAGSGELFKKLESEATAPVADVIFGGTYTLYAQNAELFEEYVAAENDQVIEEYRNTNGYSTPYTLDGSVLVINPDLTKGMTIKGYKDLTNPELKGKIATADPANSSSAYSQLTNMLAAQGGYDSESAWKYVADLFTNIDGKISSSSSNVYKTVADGEMAVGLTYEDPVVKLINDGANVEIVYPEEGTVFLPANSAIIKNAGNMDNAKKFIDFIISKDVQNVLGTTTTNRPVRDDVDTSENMKPITEIKAITEDYAYVIEHTADIVQRYNEVFVDTQSK
ncbi:ABC transporter substrate-binding protein [Vagococcus salmoninarum]|uniref:Iron ABC transporter substrate-binding protein n=1 Tax=Vagococcus salmoninarum TaxID=2739 RepID=A0A429ZNE6_9ENTE|nr:ABC transporter substrate-binding protein [Vagococcus salmoninarum]RST95211.1 iron ABC transporter substrate-binding protein [Vagococcus salmoninarum]